jgi:excinuclease UvrABC nuclease subunit
VGVFAFDVTHAKRGGINERDAGAFTQTARLQEKRHFYNCFLLQFYKTAELTVRGKSFLQCT